MGVAQNVKLARDLGKHSHVKNRQKGARTQGEKGHSCAEGRLRNLESEGLAKNEKPQNLH